MENCNKSKYILDTTESGIQVSNSLPDTVFMKNGYRFSVEHKVMTGNNILILNPDIATTYVQRAIIFQRVVVCFKHGLIVKGLVDKIKRLAICLRSSQQRLIQCFVFL